MAYKVKIIDEKLVEKFLVLWKPLCPYCKREMLPIGPIEYFCNFDPCEVWNKHISFEINIIYNIPEKKEKVSDTMKSKRKKK